MITAEHEEVVFLGCRGSLDSMHLRWKQCSAKFKEQFRNQKNGKLAPISSEGIGDHSLYCWHLFPGRADTNNEITVLQNRLSFSILWSGSEPLSSERGGGGGGCTLWRAFCENRPYIF